VDLHSRTIEVLDQRGLAERFLSEGQVAQVAYFAGTLLDVSDSPTRHPLRARAVADPHRATRATAGGAAEAMEKRLILGVSRPVPVSRPLWRSCMSRGRTHVQYQQARSCTRARHLPVLLTRAYMTCERVQKAMKPLRHPNTPLQSVM
jgi:hypothetical protein